MSRHFKQFWDGRFFGLPPVGYALRQSLVHRWVRFHSLPNAKRYASSQAEYDILLMRANVLATAVLGGNMPCWLVTNYLDEKPFEGQKDVVKSCNLQPCFRWENSLTDEALEDGAEWSVYAKKVLWQSGAFDDLLQSVADDEARVLWVSEATGAVFAPYDGGIDMILPNETLAEGLVQKYGEWCSQRSDGL